VSGADSFNLYYAPGATVTVTNGTKVSGVLSPKQIAGLTNGTQYAFAVSSANAAGESGLSNVMTATPQAGGATMTDTDGNVYQTVTIGTQVWMKENLKTTKYNDGSPISLVPDNTAWNNLVTGGYCWYNDSETYGNSYGTLYNGYAVKTGKLAPKGWHVPTDSEWLVLTTFVGGLSVAGGPLKETGTTHWASPNISASNTSGFSALGGGYRFGNGSFSNVDSGGYWWSAQTSTSNSWRLVVSYVFEYVENDPVPTAYYTWGYSVRCVKDSPTSPPAAPLMDSAIAGGGSVMVSWGSVTGATSYNLYYAAGTTVTMATGTKVTGVTSPKQVTGLINATKYAFALSAVNTAGESGLSAVITAIPQAAATAPTITLQPQSQCVTAGRSMTLSVAMTGASPISYQWFLGGNAISGATSSSYSIPSVQTANAGIYTVRGSNGNLPNATSNGAIVSVLSPAAVTDTDGNVYDAVTIGTQVWTVQNLKTRKYNDGTAIPLVTDNGTWAALTTAAYCWYENETPAGLSKRSQTPTDLYGAIYNGYVVKTGKLAPNGWHVPTDSEWTVLTTYLGDTSTAGGILKETGTTHWQSPNTGATNSVGFSGLPSGGRYNGGVFYDAGGYGYWWSFPAGSAGYSWDRVLYSNKVTVGRDPNLFVNGLSVRCVKDNPAIPPAAPVMDSAVAGGGSVSVSWGSVTGVTSYNLYYAAGITVTMASGTKVAGVTSPKLVTGLTNATKYAFALSAVNAAGESGLSNVMTATPQTTVTLPSAPTISSATPGIASVTVSWNTVSGADSFNLYYAAGTTVTMATGTKVTGATSPNQVTGLTNGTQYAFAVSAVNTAGESGLSAVQTATPSGTGACSVVPYVSDANTVLLEHFDGTAVATFNAFIVGAGCGTQFTATTPSYTYGSGQSGLGQCLTMSPPAGQPVGSSTFLKYPTQDILCIANGTVEFWVNPTAYGLSFADQGQWYNSCGGWTFRMGTDATGHLTANDWDGSGSFPMTASQVVPLNTWSHVAVTWGSTGAKLYLNGVQVSSSTDTDHPAAGFGGYLMMCCGSNASGVCRIDELRVSNVQRTSFNLCTQ
jgi:uncharacterized protein (TIGR02145 family)